MSEGYGRVDTMNRDSINKRYGITLTDNQWLILQEEVANRDDNEDVLEVVQDVCLNLDSYEQEYAWWNSRKTK